MVGFLKRHITNEVWTITSYVCIVVAVPSHEVDTVLVQRGRTDTVWCTIVPGFTGWAHMEELHRMGDEDMVRWNQIKIGSSVLVLELRSKHLGFWDAFGSAWRMTMTTTATLAVEGLVSSRDGCDETRLGPLK